MTDSYQAKRMRLYRKLNPPNPYQKARRAAYHKQYYEANKERLLAYQKQYREEQKHGTTN